MSRERGRDPDRADGNIARFDLAPPGNRRQRLIGTTIGVDVRFSGPINLGDVATGRLENLIDCLQPVLGGRVGAPDDSRVTVLEATRMAIDVHDTVRVRVVELAS